MCLSRRCFLSGLMASAAAPSLSGCSINPATGQSNFTAFMSPQEEIQIGRKEHPKLVKEFGGEYRDKRLQDYVSAIGRDLARNTELPDLPYSFTLLNSDIINAFALPGGPVNITRGLLALARDEAELASVLGHELGHVTARHSAQRYSQAMAANIGLTVLGIALGNQAVNQVAQYGAAMYLQSYSQQHELEADTLGLRYMTRAGYDSNSMANFLDSLHKHEKLQARMTGRPEDSVDEVNLLATHPRTTDRVRQAIDAASLQRAANARLNRDNFLDHVNGMIFGDDPEQGIVRGREFAHPGLRLRFEAPQGFRLINSAEKVVAKHPSGAAFAFDGAHQRVRGDVATYLVREWATNARLNGVENITVNGMEAATGTTRMQTRNSGSVDVRLVAVRFSGAQIYRFMFLTPSNLGHQFDEGFRRTTYSFRALSESEARSVEPLRLLVVPVHKGDTAQSLAATLPFSNFNTDWFLLLNDMEANQPLSPGQRVKVVAG